MFYNFKQKTKKGFALVQMLLSIFLMGIVATAIAIAGKSSTSSADNMQEFNNIVAQRTMILTQIEDCSSGDQGGNGQNVDWVMNSLPFSTYPYVADITLNTATTLDIPGDFTGAAVTPTVAGNGTGKGTLGLVGNLYCPRTLSGTSYIAGTNDPNLWQSYNGITLPSKLSKFSYWYYMIDKNVNGVSGANRLKIMAFYNSADRDAAWIVNQLEQKFNWVSTGNNYVMEIINDASNIDGSASTDKAIVFCLKTVGGAKCG
jgi:type II secretory pathway pseudopilin PulG